ncbi:MAG: branched-chain amino acid transport system permease protein [Gaiellales bacterium]|nr:branched-chain amino acid transport system permease protein [Gaiellales bacterium]
MPLTLAPFVFGEHWVVNIGIFVVMYAALATSWNLIGGFSGYLSLGHVAFFGLGAYANAIAFEHLGLLSGYGPFLLLPVIGLGVTLVAIPIGWLALRTRAATFAIVTLTLVFVGQQLAFNLHSLTGGAQGASMPLPPFALSHYELPFYLVMLALLALALGICWWVRASNLGLLLFAIRDDEDRARGLGVRTTAVKLIAFAVSAGLVAMAGAVWAYYIGFIYPQFAIDPLITIGMVLMAYLGGKGTLWGPALGAFILVPAQQYLAYRLGASELYLIGYSTVFLVVMLLLPRGILPSLRDRFPTRGSSGERPIVPETSKAPAP